MLRIKGIEFDIENGIAGTDTMTGGILILQSAKRSGEQLIDGFELKVPALASIENVIESTIVAILFFINPPWICLIRVSQESKCSARAKRKALKHQEVLDFGRQSVIDSI